jgi:hypothetical protein
MEQRSQPIAAIDPDNVRETFANGPTNFTALGPCTTLTFTTVRGDIAEQMSGGPISKFSAVVVARITMPTASVVELRNLLDRILADQPAGASGAQASAVRR